MAAEITLCVCGHAHFSADQCRCGCTIFTPDDDDTDVGVRGGYRENSNSYFYKHARTLAGDIAL